MAPITQPVPEISPVSGATRAEIWKALNAQDGTLQLLRTGGWTLLVCCIAFVLPGTILGGITPHGPRTTPGWLAVIVALMCLPFGLIVFALGVAKSLRNRYLAGRATVLPHG